MPPSSMPVIGPDPSVNFEEFLTKLDGRFTATAAAIEQFRFELDGLRFDVRRIAHESGDRLLITACLGYLPFSIESVERRDAIKAIVKAAQSLPTVRFTIDPSSKILASGFFDSAHSVMPNFIFHPLTRFLQEAGPFVRLIGTYLQAPMQNMTIETPKEEQTSIDG